MSSDAPNWRQSIITRIIDRNKRESSYHRELIQQNNRFYDTVVQLEAENLRINVENEKLRTAVATGGKDSGGSFAVLERLLAEQKHLTELHKRKGDNSQMIVDLSMKVEEQRKLLSEKEQNCAEHMKMNQILRAESAMLRSSLEELKKLDTTLRDEHTALQLAFSALEEKMRGIQDENRSLLERLMKYKSKDADKLNEENENFLKKRSDKLRRDLEDAVRETRNSISPNDLPPESASICGGDQVGGGGGGDFLYDEMLMLADEVNLSPGTGPERFHSSEPELIMKFEAHETEASAVRWNPVEKMVATGGADRRVKLWDVNKHITGTSTEARAVLGGSSAGINSVEFDSTGSYILGTSNDFGARLWTVADHRLRESPMKNNPQPAATPVIGESEKLTTHQQPLLEENKNSPNATAMTAPANPTDGVDLCNIHSILKTLSESVLGLNTKFDHMNKKVDRLMELAEKQDSKAPPPTLTSLKTIMDPIETFDDLYEFEAKLKTNKEFSSNLIEKLTHVCGANSMKGQNAAYTLVDIIFSRKLLTEFSWAGSCKKGGKPKRPFRQFEHVLKFFYTLVKKSDPTYTEVEARNFFKKKVLPNSLRRSLAPLIRASQPKTRRKGFKKRKPPKDAIPSQLSENVKEEEEDGTESEDEEEEDEHDEDLFKEMLEEFVKEEEEVVQEEISEENADVAPPVKRMRRSTKGNGLNSEFLYTT